jgi:hypothetical protein
MAERQNDPAPRRPGEARVDAATPEDVVLSKLEWYDAGGRVSERQWGDMAGLLRIHRGALDLPYLRRWAAELRVSDLLERALAEG